MQGVLDSMVIDTGTTTTPAPRRAAWPRCT
jgi:hypothetical protein